MTRRGSTVLILFTLATIAGCSSSMETNEPLERTRSAVINGTASDASQDAVVLVIHYDPTSQAVGECTGTLLAPRLVLTARHCVAATDEAVACDVKGDPIAQGAVHGNYKPGTMYVFTGKTRPNFMGGKVDPAGVGAQILDDGGKNLCNHDIALLVLKDPIEGVPIAPIRVDSDVTKGELITAVGWGVTETTTQPNTRQQRTGVKILNVGPYEAFPAVPPNEFEVGEAICSGDSGGPAFDSETNAVVGIVSRGGNATAPQQNDPSASCIGGDNLYTKLSPFKDLIMQGYELAEAEPWIEGGPDPRKLKPGSACGSGDECRSNLCLTDPSLSDGSTTCAQDCSASDCPEGQTCTTEGDAKVCRVPKKDNAATASSAGGCSASSTGSSLPGGVGLALAAFAFASVRRRRSR